MAAASDDRLDEKVKDLLSADLLVAFRHAVIFNWPAEHIDKCEQLMLAQQILDEYRGYELHPYHIYYHVEMYARNKHPNIDLPYPTNAAYKPPKHKIGYMYSDLLDDLPLSEKQSDISYQISDNSCQNKTLYDIWLHSECGTLTSEHLPPQEEQSTNIYDDLTENKPIAKKSLFGNKPASRKSLFGKMKTTS
jgi:hypothetical protein